MKFKVTKTSDYGDISLEKPLSTCYKDGEIKKQYGTAKDTQEWYCDVWSLEELIELIKGRKPFIVDFDDVPTIEIYDGYRE